MSQRKPEHTLYVDESGTKEYTRFGTPYRRDGGPTPYFVFGGILLDDAGAGKMHYALRQLKLACFGVKDVEVKANWLRLPSERQKRFIDKYGVTEQALLEFTEGVYGVVREIPCTLFAAVVNKAQVQQRYRQPYYAPAIAYDLLLQRVQMHMRQQDSFASVVMDDMSGATPKGNQYKDNLSRQHRTLKAAGSPLQPQTKPFDRIRSLRFSDSRSDERIQLADLVAYNVYRQFMDHGSAWDAHPEEAGMYKYFARLRTKFHCRQDGIIDGFGLVKFPKMSR